MQKQRGCGGIAISQSQPGTRWWMISTALQPLDPQKRPSILCTGGWVGHGVSPDGKDNFVQTVRSWYTDCAILSAFGTYKLLKGIEVHSNMTR